MMPMWVHVRLCSHEQASIGPKRKLCRATGGTSPWASKTCAPNSVFGSSPYLLEAACGHRSNSIAITPAGSQPQLRLAVQGNVLQVLLASC